MFRGSYLLLCALPLLGAGVALKTGQTVSYSPFDDGAYETGWERYFERDDELGIVYDWTIGLEWQDDVNVTDKNQSEAVAYCANLDLNGSGWRLPGVEELKSIVNYGNSAVPLIESSFVQLASETTYWSIDNVGNGFAVNLSTGQDILAVSSAPRSVRCVRGDAFTASSLSPDRDTQTVYEANNDLVWQDNNHTALLSWSNAIDYCEALTLGGFTNWRLPSFNELYTLADHTRTNPALTVGEEGFLACQSGNHWSSTTDVNTSKAVRVDFNFGADTVADKTLTAYVRCVRTPQAEINVTGNTLEIISGDDTPSSLDFTAFGTLIYDENASMQRIFHINNQLDSDLIIYDVNVSGSDAFRVSQQPMLILGRAAGLTLPGFEYVPFTIAFEPRSEGNFTAVVSIRSSDSDEGNYTFSISGVGAGDVDGDGFNDFVDENPLDGPKADADGDGLLNGDPSEIDDDNDGMEDEYEIFYGLKHWDASDKDGDLDKDGFTNYQEYLAKTDPSNYRSYPRTLNPAVLIYLLD